MSSPSSNMLLSRSRCISLLGAVAWSSTAAETVLSILEAASLRHRHASMARLSIASISLNVVALCCVALYTYQHTRSNNSLDRAITARKSIRTVLISLPVTALVTSLALIILIQSSRRHVTKAASTKLITNWNTLLALQMVVWAISCLGQILLYRSSLQRGNMAQIQEVAVSGPRDSVMSEIHTPRSNRLLQFRPSTELSPASAKSIPSPTFSSRSPPSTRSFRESLRHAIRPINSRTSLISRPCSAWESQSIASQSVDNVSHSDGFESWDTRDALVQAAPSRGTVLDPIPGSRPHSPARALDGPFFCETPDEEGYDELPRPHRMVPDTSRPPSPAVSEAHIHPLFRTESSGPAPEATPGTSIVASPLSTQAIACPPESFGRMRSRSRATSPSPLIQQRSFTRDRATSAPSLPRDVSPPVRGMTPPIPDFVLKSSPRNSLSGSRKVSLQSSPDR